MCVFLIHKKRRTICWPWCLKSFCWGIYWIVVQVHAQLGLISVWKEYVWNFGYLDWRRLRRSLARLFHEDRAPVWSLLLAFHMKICLLQNKRWQWTIFKHRLRLMVLKWVWRQLFVFSVGINRVDRPKSTGWLQQVETQWTSIIADVRDSFWSWRQVKREDLDLAVCRCIVLWRS